MPYVYRVLRIFAVRGREYTPRLARRIVRLPRSERDRLIRGGFIAETYTPPRKAAPPQG